MADKPLPPDPIPGFAQHTPPSVDGTEQKDFETYADQTVIVGEALISGRQSIPDPRDYKPPITGTNNPPGVGAGPPPPDPDDELL